MTIPVANSNFRKGRTNLRVGHDPRQGVATFSEITVGKYSLQKLFAAAFGLAAGLGCCGLQPSAAAGTDVVPVVAAVASNGVARAVTIVVLPAKAEPIAQYAAEELVWHVAQATGVQLPVVNEPAVPADTTNRIYIGSTRAAADAGINVRSLPSEAFVLRTRGGNLFIAAQDSPGDPLSLGNTFSGSLWGVYEVLERGLGVRWLWPGDLGAFVPKTTALTLGPYDETTPPRFAQRYLNPLINPNRPPNGGDARLAFSPAERARYAREQSVFLRRHRMGCSAGTWFSERSTGSGHSFAGWWERYGKDHPEWFQLLPDGRRGPRDPGQPDKVSMCVSNPKLHAKLVALWQERRAQHPGEPVNLGIAENDGAAQCVCAECRAWDGPAPDLKGLPPGLERSYLPMQTSDRYARFIKAVQALAAQTDPNVKVHFYAFENYFWAPSPEIKLDPNIVIGFVPWFRWAGWFPRTTAEHEWIKQQWLGWQRSGATVYYRPNWFLDGYSMPHVYMRQFADAFQFYARHGMAGTYFDSLQGQWAAQGPNLYLLARIHVRPHAPVGQLLDEFYAGFGPAQKNVREYFDYWEDYSLKNRERAARSIQTRRDGKFRRYAMYAVVADELYPPAVFVPAARILTRARAAAEKAHDSIGRSRVVFLQEGLNHARTCVETARVMNNPKATAAERAAALDRLIAYRRNVESLGLANLDRLAQIETESWKDVAGFTAPASMPKATPAGKAGGG